MLKELFSRNIGLKILSLSLAMVLWVIARYWLAR
jgi:hypothetical protein